MRILKKSIVFIEREISYLVMSGKLVGLLWDERPQPVLLFEEGDTICVPKDGMYLRAKTDGVRILETKSNPTWHDVTKLMKQVTFMSDSIHFKREKVLELIKEYGLSQWEAADYTAPDTCPEYIYKGNSKKK